MTVNEARPREQRPPEGGGGRYGGGYPLGRRLRFSETRSLVNYLR
jgi:hypothetical protein